jgi:putative addiction module CopG family antidote
MESRIVNLTPDLYDFVHARIESGRYENTSELMRAAMRALHREEKGQPAETSSVSSIAEGDVFRKLWEAAGAQSFALCRSESNAA